MRRSRSASRTRSRTQRRASRTRSRTQRRASKGGKKTTTHRRRRSRRTLRKQRGGKGAEQLNAAAAQLTAQASSFAEDPVLQLYSAIGSFDPTGSLDDHTWAGYTAGHP